MQYAQNTYVKSGKPRANRVLANHFPHDFIPFAAFICPLIVYRICMHCNVHHACIHVLCICWYTHNANNAMLLFTRVPKRWFACMGTSLPIASVLKLTTLLCFIKIHNTYTYTKLYILQYEDTQRHYIFDLIFIVNQIFSNNPEKENYFLISYGLGYYSYKLETVGM